MEGFETLVGDKFYFVNIDVFLDKVLYFCDDDES